MHAVRRRSPEGDRLHGMIWIAATGAQEYSESSCSMTAQKGFVWTHVITLCFSARC